MKPKSISLLNEGDILQVSVGAGGAIYKPPGGTHTLTYVDRIDDNREYFEAYEIVPFDIHSKEYLNDDTKFIKLDNDAISIGGLASSKEWAIILEPRRIYPTPKNLGEKAQNLCTTRGNIGQTPFTDRLRQIIHNSGGASGLRSRGGDPTGYVSSNPSQFGLFAPVGIKRGEWKEYDAGFAPQKLKKPKREKDKKFGTLGAEEGQVIDLPLEFAHAALGIDEKIINAVMNPNSKKLKALKTLRQLKDIDDLAPYLEDRDEFIYEGTLLQARRTGLLRHDYVRDMLSEVFEESESKPINRFKDALLTGLNNPDRILEDFVEIDGDEEEQNYVIEELEEAHEEHLKKLATSSKSQIKKAWQSFASDYLKLKTGQEIENPERYLNQNDDVAINLVKAIGRRQASHVVIEKDHSAAIMLPQAMYPKM